MDNFFGEGLWGSRGRGFEGRKDRGGGRLLGLRVEDILSSLCGGSESSIGRVEGSKREEAGGLSCS